MLSNNKLHKAVVGDYRRTCDKSGFDFRRSELVFEPQTRLLVHPKFADPWHPLDKPMPPIVERRTPKWE